MVRMCYDENSYPYVFYILSTKCKTELSEPHYGRNYYYISPQQVSQMHILYGIVYAVAT